MMLLRLIRQYISSLFAPDPTRDWKEVSALKLTFDLFKGTLNNIAFNDPVHKLAVFGKPGNKNPHRFEAYEWQDKGLSIEADRGRVSSFELVFSDWEKKWNRYNSAQVIFIKEKTIEISRATTRLEIEKFFGQPSDELSEDGVPSLIDYHYQILGIQFQFGLQEELQVIRIYQPEEQAYKLQNSKFLKNLFVSVQITILLIYLSNSRRIPF